MSEPTRRADAQRNIDAILDAAKDAFASAGVDVPVRRIAGAAGVGVGTLYRHFPQRADLVAAVFRREVDATAAAAEQFEVTLPPLEALDAWLRRYGEFIATKRGLAAALHSGDPTFASLPSYFSGHLRGPLQRLLDAGVRAGSVREGVDPDALLSGIANLAGASAGGSVSMLDLLIDGLRVTRR